MKLEDLKNGQEIFKSHLGKVKKRKQQNKIKRAKKDNTKFERLYNSRNKAINFFDDYSSVMPEAKNKTTKATIGTGLKMLTPKQTLQRLPIAFAQVKLEKTQKSY